MNFLLGLVCWIYEHDWYREKGAKRRCVRCGRVEVLGFNSWGEHNWVKPD